MSETTAPGGLERIERTFKDLRDRGLRGLIPFVVGQHPRPGATREMLPAIEKAGASLIEVGIPFSDPIADGPVISGAMHAALECGATPDGMFEEVAAARTDVTIPIIAMVSASVVWRSGGPSGFASSASSAGFDGLIVPDVPLDEAEPFIDGARQAGLGLSLLVAPRTSSERAGAIARASTGFVYLVARAGVTGSGGGGGGIARLGDRVRAIREATPIPVAVGFGISSPDQVRVAAGEADAVIVGSALVGVIASASDPVVEASALVRTLAEPLGAAGS